ncbi:hypothetical protein [Microbacterium sp. GXF6406]
MTDERAPDTPPIELAPPLVSAAPPSAPAAPHVPPAAGPGPALPPYATASAPPPGYGGYPVSPYSAPPTPPSGGNRRALVIILISVLSVVVIAIALVAAMVASVLTASPEPVPAPVFPSTAEPLPSTAPSAGGNPISDGEDDALAGAEIADRLETTIEDYKRARSDGSLWDSIPQTERNETAVTAFLYLLTDMKVATIWGVDAATAARYETEMMRLEEALLAGQPLGSSLKIVLSDRTFEYDGETGEGGYTDE